MGHHPRGTVSGTISMNGKKVKSLSQHRRHIGYVTQDDVMHAHLTVKEILTYQARLRLTSEYDDVYVSQSVDEIIKLLGLSKVCDNIVGESEENGISGGQRRRVSIGKK